MKKWSMAASLVVALLLITVVPSHAAWARQWHHHGGGPRVFIGVGPVWPYPYWYYPPHPYYFYPSPPIVVQQPPVYVEQQQGAPAPPIGSAPSVQVQAYWYYCQPSGAYYPHVQTCAEPWVKVPPRAP